MAIRRATNNLIVFIGLIIILVLHLCFGTRHWAAQPVFRRAIGASLVLVLVVAIVQFGMRIFLSERLQAWTECFSYSWKRFIFFVHKIAVVAVFALWGSSVLVHDLHRQSELILLAIQCVVVMICLADLVNATSNVWHLQKPVPPTAG